MADRVSTPLSFAQDLEVLRALGGAGNAVFVLAAVDSDGEAALLDSLIESCTGMGWRPVIIEVDPASDTHARRPHDVVIRTSPELLLSLLADRFHAGAPIHYLRVDPSAPAALATSLAGTGIRPWLLAQPTEDPTPRGYREMSSDGSFRWWIADEQTHFAGALASALETTAKGRAEPPHRGLKARVSDKGRLASRRLLAGLPGFLTAPAVRRRHLRLVQDNQPHLVDQALLSPQEPQSPSWITPQGLPEPPVAGLFLGPLSPKHSADVRTWLEADSYDSDELLDRRLDNHGDELGRTLAALRTRVELHSGAANTANGGRVLFDARSLQSPSFGTRGIGRFAYAALRASREVVPDAELDLLIDRGLEELTPEIAGDSRLVTKVTSVTVGEYGTLLEPSPMTATPRPLIPLLHSNVTKIAIVFDFIPAHFPTVYLPHCAAAAEYAAALDALSRYDSFLCISEDTASEMSQWLQAYGRDLPSGSCQVTWPDSIHDDSVRVRIREPQRSGPIVIMTGDDARKNTFGALAAVGAATAGPGSTRDIRVVGMAGQEVRVHHLAIAAGVREGEVVTCGRLTDEELRDLLTSASLVVVASFDEGLSLPVIEAAMNGTPVVASDIPAHRELIGSGSFLAPPNDLGQLAEAIRKHQGNRRTWSSQARTLSKHQHRSLEQSLRDLLRSQSQETGFSSTATAAPRTKRKLSVGVATPWEPQATGVADFSVATITELAKLVDVTVYTTADAQVPAGIHQEPMTRLWQGEHSHDVLISVVGNSHFHVPHIDILESQDCVVIAHDTRLVEYYAALRSKAGAENLMLRGQGTSALSPSFEEQVEDMRLLQNAGFWEVARRAQALILHSPSAAPRIMDETGVRPHVLPFAHYRSPAKETIAREDREAARARLGIRPDRLQLATFGYVDIRTKLTDVVVEAAAWLTQWGHDVSLHVVGSASPDQARVLSRRASMAGVADFAITGYVPEDTYRDYLLAIDIGVQLRISPLLGVSGPLADLAAFGTSAVASRGLAIDVDTPDFITRLPDEISPLLVAEVLEDAAGAPVDSALREQQRIQYLDRMAPKRYAEELVRILEEVVAR